MSSIVVAPIIAGAVLGFSAYNETHKPDADPCKPPMIRLESANLGALPGPNSPACLAARRTAEEKKNGQKPEERKP